MNDMARKPESRCNIVGRLEAALAWIMLGAMMAGGGLVSLRLIIWAIEKFTGGGG